MWNPFSQSFNTFPEQAGQAGLNFDNSQSQDSGKIELPGGGFIEKPRTSEPQSRVMYIQSNPHTTNAQSDEFDSTEERLSLMNRLDMLLEERAERLRTLQDLSAQGEAIQESLKQVNSAYNDHSHELIQLENLLRTKKEQMIQSNQNKRSDIASLKETLQKLQKEETRSASYKIIAAESRVLKKQIAKANEEKKVLQQKIDELDHKADKTELRSKIIEQEEKALEKNLLAYVQKLAGSGLLKYSYHSSRYSEFDEEEDFSDTRTNQAQIHDQPEQAMIPKISKDELAQQYAITKDNYKPEIVEGNEVLEDNGAPQRKVEKLDEEPKSNTITEQAQIHHQPKETRPALPPTNKMIPQISKNELAEQFAITKADPQSVEKTEVVGDNGAPKRKVKKGGLFSSLKKLFRRKPKRRSGCTKQSKNELKMNALKDPKSSETADMVTVKKTNSDGAAELGGEISAPEITKCYAKVTRE